MRTHRRWKSALQAGVLSLALAAGGAAPARADYAPHLGAAPYALEQTVVGVDGWMKRLPSLSDNPDSARVVALRWNDGQPALALRGANMKNTSFPAATGERVHIAFHLALTFAERNGLREFRMWFDGAPIGEVFFDFKSGLGYGGAGNVSGGTVILPREEIAINSFYDYDIFLDYKKQSYGITVRGRKKDGSPLEYAAQDVAFLKKEGKSGVHSITILNSSRLPVYLQGMKIEAR
jgi:hypothetical protein